MKLRKKVLLLIGLVWAGFLIITYVASHFFLIHNFLSLENDRANRDLDRVYQALDQNSYSLYTYTADWSHWTDAYQFMLGKNPHFVDNNFKMPAFINSNINLITYWDKNGKLIAGKAINTKTQKYTHYPKGLEQYIYPGSPLVKLHHDLRGYILTANGIMMIASTTVTDGNKSKPPIGMTVFGRLLSPLILQNINRTVSVNSALFLPEQIAKNSTLTKAFNAALNQDNAHIIISPDDQNTLHGYSIIKDINGKPIGMLQTTTARILYMSGLKMISYYLFCFIALGISFSLLMLWLLRTLVIKRLESLDRTVQEIGQKNALSQRVEEIGNDEISSLSKQINRMMGVIEIAQEKLENRVKERTQELQKSNIQLQKEIVERKSIEKDLTTHKEHLVQLAHYDSLTSLPNRIFFNEMLAKILGHAGRKKIKLALLYIDLDRFKTINDALGHSTGDLVLKEIANRFVKALRTGDVLARLNGDEFIVLLNDIEHPKIASMVAEKILEICARPLQINDHQFVLSASVGICTYPEDGTSLESLVKNADMAMYKAKRAGGNAFHYYTKEMDLEARERIKLEAALRNAISEREFVLYYQPKLQLSSGKITGVEALIRWDHPLLGLVSPSTFIPLAEETGLILQIGEWVIREACQANKAWQREGYQPISVAVNLSAKQFRHQNIAQMISDILSETQLEPQYLELEITETAIMDNIDLAIEKLTALRNMGVKITIDDFGTGYTSIGYLKQFPVSVIKIDQSFIKGLPTNHNDTSITTAVIALAHSLNIQVVAEGVETPEQLQFLADHDCDMVQGYYLSQPLSKSNIVLQFIKTAVEKQIIEY